MVTGVQTCALPIYGVRMTSREREQAIAQLEKQMREAARMMEYEYAAALRDQIIELRGLQNQKKSKKRKEDPS